MLNHWENLDIILMNESKTNSIWLQGYTRFQLKLGGLAVDDINRFIACRKILDDDDVLVGDANTGNIFV